MEKDIIITPEAEEQITTIDKEQGFFPQGTIEITSNGIQDVSSYATADVNVDFNLQDKDVSITQNGIDIITADEGYMGMSSVSVNTNVPPSKYAPQHLRFQNFAGTSLLEETRLLDTTKMTTFENMFAYCSNLETVDMTGFNTSNVTTLYYMFRDCPKLKDLDFSSFDINNVGTANGMFMNSFKDSNNLIDLDLSSFVGTKFANASTLFSGCTYLRSVDLSNLTMRTYGLNIGGMFYNCTHLEEIDLSSFDFSRASSYSNIFTNCGTQTTTGLTKVYVKDQAAQNWVLNLSSSDKPSSWSTANVVIKN